MSVAAQTQRPAQLILVDDASPDDTAALLERLRERFGSDWIRIVRLSSNVGPASARNAGWDAASQKYIAFLDSDDAWHPRKIEIQLAWMQSHPDVALTGHAALQLVSEKEMPVDPGSGEAREVSKPALYASNRFITPSVMVRSDVAQRFEPGKRHMEDYLLWLEIAASGHKIFRLPQALAYTFKAPFGGSGLSGHLWRMEKGELAVFSALRRKGLLGSGLWLFLSGFSLLKFVRRMLMLAAGYSPGGAGSKPTLLYPASYLVLTQSMTALLVCSGLLGRAELAAEIGVVQAATLATFFAFSGNARNLILNVRTMVPLDAILGARLVLLVPLGAAAALLCAIVVRVDLTLVLLLVGRRAIEWIGELQLSECELMGRHVVARRSLVVQSVLLFGAIVVVGLWPEHSLWAIAAWALLPLLSIVGFIRTALRPRLVAVRDAFALLLPHYGSTAVSGFSLYAFRALLILVAGKAVAGDLFVAFAIGSFPGTIFANVLGPSVSLHEQRIGRSYLPRLLWLALVAYFGAGLTFLGLAWSAPGTLAATGKAPLFWVALGWSLVGGAVMLIAQRVRLRLFAADEGQTVFGADVLMHVYLIVAVPALYATGRQDGLAMLYLLNAALALLFYWTATRGLARFGERAEERALAVLAFLIFLPLFFHVTGKLFNPGEALWDSGGLVQNLPLPVSLLACSTGLILLGRYERATPALWTIFGLLFLMLVSTAVVGVHLEPVERAKMLMMVQIIVPTFGLVLGALTDPTGTRSLILYRAILAVIVLVVPVQLVVTWTGGELTLGHSLIAFGVYQHLQFVPVILVCGFLLALSGLWNQANRRERFGLAALFVLVATYVSAAHSVLAMLLVLAAAGCFAAARLYRHREFSALVTAVLVIGAFAGYNVFAQNTIAFHNKFDFLFPPDGIGVSVSPSIGARKSLFGGWVIVGLPYNGSLMVIRPMEPAQRSVVTVEGDLFNGEISFSVANESQTSTVLKVSVDRPGPFKIELEMDRDHGDAYLHIGQTGNNARGVVRSLRWISFAPKSSQAKVESAGGTSGTPGTGKTDRDPDTPVTVPSGRPNIRNVQERFSDWKLFGHGILESPQSLLFGHAKPLAREQRSSAHNFYIDFVYNFGGLALLPLFVLIGHTGVLLWRYRVPITASAPLAALVGVVLFLVLIESSLKVSLRQPYSGIAIYFLWGLLLARLADLGRRRVALPEAD